MKMSTCSSGRPLRWLVMKYQKHGYDECQHFEIFMTSRFSFLFSMKSSSGRQFPETNKMYATLFRGFNKSNSSWRVVIPSFVVVVRFSRPKTILRTTSRSKRILTIFEVLKYLGTKVWKCLNIKMHAYLYRWKWVKNDDTFMIGVHF